MATEPVRRDSDSQEDAPAGVLFALGLRGGLLVAVGVAAYAIYGGLAPDAAVLRGLVALIGLAGLGWLAEQATRNRPAPARTQQPAQPAREQDENRQDADLEQAA
jgi:threonine/homoserine/homoserine lactone efflux protein